MENKALLAEKLLRQRHEPMQHPVVSGFDGFVDEMISVVKERRSLEEFDAVADIATFGQLISNAAGHSSLREIVVNQVDAGGCAVNMGDGLVNFGLPLDLFATLGEPEHPAFAELTKRCRTVESWGAEPGRTLAFEFSDGKLMFSAVRQLADLDAAYVQKKLSAGPYRKCCEEASLIALTDWTLYPHMTDVWKVLCEEVYSQLPAGKRFMIDLVDPSSRSEEDIRAMIEVLPDIARNGILTLGLNGNEANLLCRLLGLPEGEDAEDSVAAQATALKNALKIDEVAVHWIKYAAVDGPAGAASITGPYCPSPKKSTGAGDRFNAGFVLATVLGFSPWERLAIGTASSGFFVREARSANLDELAQFLMDWEGEAP